MKQENVNARLRDIMGRNYKFLAEKLMHERSVNGKVSDGVAMEMTPTKDLTFEKAFSFSTSRP